MVLWWINVGLAMAVTALLPFFFFSNPTFGSSLEGLTAIWLVPIFPCVVASGVGGIIATQVSQGVGAACSVPGTLPHAPQPHTHPHTCRPPQELQRASSTWATSCGAWVCPSASPSSPSTTSACCPTAYRHGSSLCPASCRWVSARAGVVPLPGWHRCGRKGSLPSAPLNPVPTLHHSPHGRRCHGGNHSGGGHGALLPAALHQRAHGRLAHRRHERTVGAVEGAVERGDVALAGDRASAPAALLSHGAGSSCRHATGSSAAWPTTSARLPSWPSACRRCTCLQWRVGPLHPATLWRWCCGVRACGGCWLPLPARYARPTICRSTLVSSEAGGRKWLLRLCLVLPLGQPGTRPASCHLRPACSPVAPPRPVPCSI